MRKLTATPEEYDEMLGAEPPPTGDSVQDELNSEVSKLSGDDSDTGNEIADNETLAQSFLEQPSAKREPVAAPPKEVSVAPEAPREEKGMPGLTDSKFEDLLAQYKQDQIASLLGRAGNKVGQSMAGRYSGNFKPDNSMNEVIEKNAKEPIDMYMKLLEARRKAMPKEVGKRYQLGSTVDPKTGNVVQAVFDVTTGQLAPTEQIRGFATQIRENKRTGELLGIQPGSVGLQQIVTSPEAAAKGTKEKVQLERSILDNKQNERVDKSRDEFLKDTDDARNALGGARNAKALIQSGKEINGDMIRAIQNNLARSSGEKGTMTEGDVAGFGGRGAVLNKLERMISSAATGKLPDADRKFLTDFANVMEKRASQYVKDRSNYFTKNLHKDLKSSKNLRNVNFDESSVQNLIGVNDAIQSADSDSVMMQSPDGKRAKVKKDQVQKYLDKGAVIVDGK